MDEGLAEAMEAQRKGKAVPDRALPGQQSAAYTELAGAVTTDFVGYEHGDVTTRIVGIIVDSHAVDRAEEGQQAAVVLEKTPFYAEGGGQVADQGVIETETGRVRINDVRLPVRGLISHLGVVEDGYIAVGSTAQAKIGQDHRKATHGIIQQPTSCTGR